MTKFLEVASSDEFNINLSDQQPNCIDPTPPHLCRYCSLWGLIPLRFCSFPKYTAVGKRSLHSEGKSFLINTFPCGSLGDVGFHRMLDPSFWVTTIHPPYGHTHHRVWGPHFWLGHDSNTICNDPRKSASHICAVPQKDQSQLRLLVVVNKAQIYLINTQFGTHHTPTHIT